MWNYLDSIFLKCIKYFLILKNLHYKTNLNIFLSKLIFVNIKYVTSQKQNYQHAFSLVTSLKYTQTNKFNKYNKYNFLLNNNIFVTILAVIVFKKFWIFDV